MLMLICWLKATAEIVAHLMIMLAIALAMNDHNVNNKECGVSHFLQQCMYLVLLLPSFIRIIVANLQRCLSDELLLCVCRAVS